MFFYSICFCYFLLNCFKMPLLNCNGIFCYKNISINITFVLYNVLYLYLTKQYKNMENTYFTVNEKVKVVNYGANASDFNNGLISIMGVYQYDDWRDIEFTIGGEYKTISFKHNKFIYGAYPLIYDNKIVGYVYNDALQLIK